MRQRVDTVIETIAQTEGVLAKMEEDSQDYYSQLMDSTPADITETYRLQMLLGYAPTTA